MQWNKAFINRSKWKIHLYWHSTGVSGILTVSNMNKTLLHVKETLNDEREDDEGIFGVNKTFVNFW